MYNAFVVVLKASLKSEGYPLPRDVAASPKTGLDGDATMLEDSEEPDATMLSLKDAVDRGFLVLDADKRTVGFSSPSQRDFYGWQSMPTKR